MEFEIKVSSLEEVIEKFIDYRGKTPKKTTSGVPLITAKIIKDGFIQSTKEFIAEEDYDSWMRRGIPEKGDVVLTTEAPLGEVAQINTNEKIALAQRVITLRGKKEVLDNNFLKYSIQGPVIQSRLRERESGSTVTGIRSAELKKVLIDYPNYNTQKKIGNTLKNIDDKIIINKGIINNLEQLAQTLFKRWFVDFEFPNENGNPYKSSGGEMVESELGMIPADWYAGKFKDISTNFDKKRIPLSKLERLKRESIYPYYGAASLMDYVDDYIFDGVHLLIGEDGSVIDKDGFPVLQYVWGKFWVNNHAHVLKGRENFTVEYIYLLLKQTNVTNIVTGAVQPKINQTNLNNIRVVIPEREVLKLFNKFILPIFNKVRLVYDENSNLEKLRDTLLPKLLSGEIELPEENEVTKDVPIS